jgi:tRNA (cytidine/uridine-2'-O-)-methyltransferase
MRLALYQPDIAPNAGTMLRLCACLGIGADIVEPCGFPVGDRAFHRAGLDYLESVSLRRHSSWSAFQRVPRGRLVLLTTHATRAYTAFRFAGEDTIVVGRETAGVPTAVHAAADARLVIPMHEGARALNVAVAAAMVLGEALRQTALLPAAFDARSPSQARA